MGLHQVLASLLCVSSDDHEGADDLLRLRQVRAGLAVQHPFQVLYLPQLAECLFELVASQVDQGHVPLDLAGPDVFQSVRALVDLHSFVEIDEGLCDLAGLLLPRAELSGDTCEEVGACELRQLLEETLGFPLILNRVLIFSLLGVDLRDLQVDVA